MTFFEGLPYMLGVGLALILLILAMSKPKRRQDDAREDDSVFANLDADAGKSYRDGGWRGYGPDDAGVTAARDAIFPDPAPRPFHRSVRHDDRVTFGRRVKREPVELNRRQLEHVNNHRRMQGKQPLNLLGFQNALRGAPTSASDDWINYLILYEVLSADETSHRISVDSGITVTPGGEYGSAGAQGSWSDDPKNAAMVGDPYAAVAAAAFSPTTRTDTPDPSSYAPATPSPSVPDPAPYSPSNSDTSSSYSSSSDSSSSSSSDSGSSSGGDGGGSSSGGGDGS